MYRSSFFVSVGSIVFVVCLLVPLCSGQNVGSQRQSEAHTLPEDRSYWERLLQDTGGSMDNNGEDGIPGMVVVPSLDSFDDTWDNLRTSLQNAPVNILAEISHSDAATNVGLTLEPNMLAVFGNPALGTPIMQQNREAGIDLPQKMLVWQETDGNVYAGYNSVAYLESRHEGIDDAPTLDRIAGALLQFASAATGVPLESIQVEDNVDLDSTGIITEASDADFETTWERLVAAIESSPANIAFTVDHSATAQSIGLSLLPTRLVVFGNPNFGTPLMQESPTAGIDLPLKFLVWEDEESNVQVTTNDIDFVAARHGVDDVDLTQIKTAVENFMTVATET